MNDEEFTHLLKTHDWTFEYQDSFESPDYRRGYEERERINIVLKDNPSFVGLYNQNNPFIN